MILYHGTPSMKASEYEETGVIPKPIICFTSLQASMSWSSSLANKRVTFYEIDTAKITDQNDINVCPQMDNKFGEVWKINTDIDLGIANCILSLINNT
jgi:hypothetical protein